MSDSKAPYFYWCVNDKDMPRGYSHILKDRDDDEGTFRVLCLQPTNYMCKAGSATPPTDWCPTCSKLYANQLRGDKIRKGADAKRAMVISAIERLPGKTGTAFEIAKLCPGQPRTTIRRAVESLVIADRLIKIGHSKPQPYRLATVAVEAPKGAAPVPHAVVASRDTPQWQEYWKIKAECAKPTPEEDEEDRCA